MWKYASPLPTSPLSLQWRTILTTWSCTPATKSAEDLIRRCSVATPTLCKLMPSPCPYNTKKTGLCLLVYTIKHMKKKGINLRLLSFFLPFFFFIFSSGSVKYNLRGGVLVFLASMTAGAVIALLIETAVWSKVTWTKAEGHSVKRWTHVFVPPAAAQTRTRQTQSAYISHSLLDAAEGQLRWPDRVETRRGNETRFKH